VECSSESSDGSAPVTNHSVFYVISDSFACRKNFPRVTS
jgi:hypothetical protein